MALTSAYLTRTGNLGEMFGAIQRAKAPERFNSTFLTDLGFSNTNDLLLIGVFKALGFIDETGVPTERYYQYLDESQSKAVMAQGIRKAYADLFAVDGKANEMSKVEVKQKLKTLTRGAKGGSVLEKMATTFTALCKFADFAAIPAAPKRDLPPSEVTPKPTTPELPVDAGRERRRFDLAYNIYIELPPTRDQAVYDAIFRSLKEHIL